MVKAVKLAHPDEDMECFKRFTGSFAKWRYETVHKVCHQLRPYRHVSENYMQRCWFSNTQEGVLVNKVFEANADPQFWLFIVHGDDEVLAPIEEARHWGQICDCPQHIQD